ncbi:unnamed protein product [Ixodes persulcatus]
MLLAVLVVAAALGSTEPLRWPFGGQSDKDGFVITAPGVKLDNSTAGESNATGPDRGDRCQCVGADCGCCIHMSVPRIGLNDTGCVNVTYNSAQYALSFTVSLGDSIVFNRTISGKDPPRMCFSAPQIERLARLCLHFYNMSYSRDRVSGCLRMEAQVLGEVVASYQLGCFDLADVRTRIRDALAGMRPFRPQLDARDIVVQSGHASASPGVVNSR